MTTALTLFFLMVLWHFIADYVLQSEFIAKHKNPGNSVPAAPWYYVLFAHCCTHAIGVFYITSSPILALIELVVHFIIDYRKCRGDFDIHVDQFWHILTKVVLIAILILLI